MPVENLAVEAVTAGTDLAVEDPAGAQCDPFDVPAGEVERVVISPAVSPGPSGAPPLRF